MSDFKVGIVVGIFIGIILSVMVAIQTSNSWVDGAIGAYEGTVVCEEALGEWVCKKGDLK